MFELACRVDSGWPSDYIYDAAGQFFFALEPPVGGSSDSTSGPSIDMDNETFIEEDADHSASGLTIDLGGSLTIVAGDDSDSTNGFTIDWDSSMTILASDNSDVALLSAVDDVDGNASYGVAAGLINGIIVGIAATIGLGALIYCQAGKRNKDIEEPLLDN